MKGGKGESWMSNSKHDELGSEIVNVLMDAALNTLLDAVW